MLCLDMREKLTAILFGLQVLKHFPFPVTITTFQFAIGTTLVLFMWIFNLHKRPKITSAQLVEIFPLAIVHTMGNLFTNMSLGKVVVSFTHTIKAMKPFFLILLSAMFLGEKSMDNITLFSVIAIMSLFLLTPVALFMEGIKFTPTYLQAAGLNAKDVCIKLLGYAFMLISSIRHITKKVGAAVMREVVAEELVEGHGDIGTKELMHMSEEEIKEYVARSIWYPLYHPFVHEK
ncbi:hypothetical protein GIB67_019835 [Kingdonia uniflora]|uniref:Sugar phosphate transporter domain-containing protein n=1 Tax=Kingdonia uniflora TaxID=39325 RepID=A0A7J7MK75_9MAGN|nr:hypothetical protein GIB67_019835 [Kingdonia uniflora]